MRTSNYTIEMDKSNKTKNRIAPANIRVLVPLIQTQNKKSHLTMELFILVRPKTRRKKNSSVNCFIAESPFQEGEQQHA